MGPEENFIPLIHNYCDRWCERCEFTARCHVFAAEQEMTDEEKDIESGAFARNLAHMLADAQKMLLEKATEFGIDLSSANSEEYAERRRQKRAAVKAELLADLSEKYGFDARPVLESKEEWLNITDADEDTTAEVLGVIYWYQFFITAKIQRGLSGILDDDGDEDRDQIIDTQSDANGSVKIALIAIERSILAWTYLLSNENAAVVRPMIELLEKIKLLTEQKFPYARDFVRPGFDEIEIVM